MLNDRPRMTMWYEVCVIDQISEGIRTKGSIVTGEKVDKSSEPLGESYKVVVKSLTGKCFLFRVNENHLGLDLMMMIQDVEGIPPDKCRLVCNGKTVGQDDPLANYNLHDGLPFFLILNSGKTYHSLLYVTNET